MRLIERGGAALFLLLVAGSGCGRVWPGNFAGRSESVEPSAALSVRVGEFVAGTVETASVAVTLLDAQGQAQVGVTPVLGVSGTQNTVNCSSTDPSGVALCAIGSSVSESKTVSLIDPPLSASSVQVFGLPANTFRFVWNAENSVTLPLVSGSRYNFTVFWGDGTSDQITSAVDSDRTHTYASPGHKTITLSGEFDHFQFATNPERLLDITRWGSTGWGSMNGMFKGAVNLIEFGATDVPDTSGVTDFSEAFRGATSFNGDVTNWNTQSATNLSGMFKGAVAFDRDISDKGGGVWDVSSVTLFSEMFSADISDFSVLFTPAYVPMIFDQNISNWDTSSATHFTKMFAGCESFHQDLGNWVTSNAVDMSFMFMHAKLFRSNLRFQAGNWDVSLVQSFEGMFQGASIFNGDITNWNTTSATNLRRMFANAPQFNRDLSGWQTSQVLSLYETFYRALAFNQPIGAWDTSSNLSLYRTFWAAAAFDQNLNGWNTSLVTTMHATFFGATSFNNGGAPLNWNTSSVTRTSNMFAGATSYNQPMEVSGPVWDFSKVKFMEEMFQGAIAFNQDLDSWNTSAVENMREMFSGASQFNGAVGAWNTQNVTSFYAIFQGASSFNRPLTNWDISLATNVASMFYGATEFNQNVSHMIPLSATDTSRMFLDAGKFNNGGSTCGMYEPTRALEWATSAVQNMDHMFEGAICFNQEVNLATGSVTSMVQMFSDADKFNQPIVSAEGYWDFSGVRDMTGMFRRAFVFNRPLDSWNTSAVETMNYMFFDAANFDQDIHSWNVSSVSDARAFHGGINLASWVPSERPNFTPSAASRRMFLTQDAFTGNLGGVPGADLECNSDPGKPMTGNYRALLVAPGQRSVQPTSLNWPIAPLVQYTRPDGTRVTTATSGALFGPFAQAISATGGAFWTGMDPAYSQIENCTNWTSSDASAGGVSSSSSAITSDATVCDQSRRLLCLEE